MKLEIGYNPSFEVRKEKYLANCKDNFTILYLSDLHLNRFSKNMVYKIGNIITELNPTILLLGGDYVDSKNGLIYLNSLLASFAHRQNVFAVAGNHDYSFGLNEIKTIMTANNIAWIENNSCKFKFKNTSSLLCKRCKIIMKITKKKKMKKIQKKFIEQILYEIIDVSMIQ